MQIPDLDQTKRWNNNSVYHPYRYGNHNKPKETSKHVYPVEYQIEKLKKEGKWKH